jgi:hypothetical protein
VNRTAPDWFMLSRMTTRNRQHIMGWTFVAAGALSGQAPAIYLLVGCGLVWSLLYAGQDADGR